FMKENPGLGNEPIDIEDLVNIGRSCGPCPYYVSRELHKVADILFTPYNYLIDRGYRKSLTIGWHNSILIFDEAHNLESICADAASFDLPSGLLTACISEAKNCIDLSIARREKSSDKSCNPDNFAILRALLLKLEKRIAEVHIESKELAVLLEEDTNVTDSGVSHKMKGTVCRLESMGDILKIIFRDGGNSHAEHYRVHVQEVEASGAAAFKGKASRILSWWCFNPGIAMEEFSRLGVGSIILTSGTLSPMDSFALEFKLEFPVRLENPHVISANQIWAGVVPAGPSGFSFNSSFRNRDTLEYKLELGNAIVNFARIVPDGLLIFFPSYYLLDQCIGCWKNMSHTNSTNSSTIWERICKYKQPVVEPRQSSLFPLSIDDYMTKLKDTSTSGAVFFAVCRGKVSEGLDFADHAGRAVIITGMPFATRTDPKVRLKREYLDQHAGPQQMGCKVLTGEEWYSQQASRAVNQAVGRVIRHRHDYGAIIFCDERFAQSNRQSQISLWIQPHIKSYSKFGDVVFMLTRFFRDGGIRGPTKLELTRTEDQGNVNKLKTMQPPDKVHLEKFLTPLTTPVDPNCSVKLSSTFEVKQGNISSQMGEILPANRSSLTSYKQNQNLILKRPSDLFSYGKLLVSGRKRMQHNNCEIVDLTSNALAGEKELIVPCSMKKHKILKIETDLRQQFEKTHEHLSIDKKTQPNNPSFITDLVKEEGPQTSDSGILQNVQAGSALLLGDEMTAQKKTNVPCGDDETRGSAFLIQVQEKLTDAEYKEFVGSLFFKDLRIISPQSIILYMSNILKQRMMQLTYDCKSSGRLNNLR
ncbi:hypothetical protein F0562_022969, partial [Nyssa sinensis]